MGIVKFCKNFSPEPVDQFEMGAKNAYFDGSYYWECCIGTHNTTTEWDFYGYFWKYMTNTLLSPHIIQGRSNSDAKLQIIFDSDTQRRYSKMAQCIARSADSSRMRSSNRIRFSWTIERLNYYFESIGYESLDNTNLYVSSEEFFKMVSIVMAPEDTDDLIDKSFFGDNNGMITILSNGKQISISDMLIYSGDTDFLSFSPHCTQVAVLNYENVVEVKKKFFFCSIYIF